MGRAPSPRTAACERRRRARTVRGTSSRSRTSDARRADGRGLSSVLTTELSGTDASCGPSVREEPAPEATRASITLAVRRARSDAGSEPSEIAMVATDWKDGDPPVATATVAAAIWYEIESPDAIADAPPHPVDRAASRRPRRPDSSPRRTRPLLVESERATWDRERCGP